MKSLKPSLKEKKRYLLFSGKKEEVEKAILDYIGVLGYSKAGVSFVGNVLAVNRGMLNEVKGSLEMADIRVLRVSGSLKKLRGK